MAETATLPVYVVEGDVCCGTCCRPLQIGQGRTARDMALAIGAHSCRGPVGRVDLAGGGGQSGALPFYGSSTALVEVRLSAADRWELFCLPEPCEWVTDYPRARPWVLAAPLGQHLLSCHARLTRYDKTTGRLVSVDGGVL